VPSVAWSACSCIPCQSQEPVGGELPSALCKKLYVCVVRIHEATTSRLDRDRVDISCLLQTACTVCCRLLAKACAGCAGHQSQVLYEAVWVPTKCVMQQVKGSRKLWQQGIDTDMARTCVGLALLQPLRAHCTPHLGHV
jgi:hypothetical protein